MKIFKNKLTKAGASLTEILIVIAVLCILFGVASIEVTKYRQKLTQLEMDGFAKEIFMAAQNSISLAEGQGYLGVEDSGTADTVSEYTGVSYCIIGPDNYSDLSDNTKIMSTILPEGSIEETLRGQGNYVVRFHKESGTVMDVFYARTASQDGRYGYDISDGDYNTLVGEYIERRTDGKAYGDLFGKDKAIIGYYGGAIPGASQTEYILKEPVLTIINGDVLSAEVSYPYTHGDNFYNINDNVAIDLIIEGVSSGAQKTINIKSESASAASTDISTILDGVRNAEPHFAQLFAGAGFIPGEDIKVSAVARRNGSNGNSRAESTPEITNSLYASAGIPTEGTGIGKIANAEISSFRHLENLYNEVSAVGMPVVKATQITDLNWKDFADADTTITGSAGAALHGAGTYAPVTAEGLNYDGRNHVISSVVINVNTDAALFASLTNGSRVNDLILEDFNVCSANGNAGALCASMNGGTVQNVLVYNNIKTSPDDSDLVIEGATNVGGLIGTLNNSVVSGGAAAVYVESASGSAGGLIGLANEGSSLSYSYAGGHTNMARYVDNPGISGRGHLNVSAPIAAGGLIGQAEGVSISCCYSTASVYSSTESGLAGGLCANMTGGSVKKSYASGKAVCAGGKTVYPFINGSGTDCSGGGNYYLKNMSAHASTAEIAGVTGVTKGQSAPDFLLTTGNTTAYTYDDAIAIDYKGLYSFPTVEQLSGSTVGETYCNVTTHYGDWQIPTLEELIYYFVNEDSLYLLVDPEKLTDQETGVTAPNFTVSITGETSGANIVMLIDVNTSEGTPAATVTKIGYAANGYLTWPEITEDLQPLVDRFNSQISIKDGCIQINLDDITKEKSHFAELFADDLFKSMSGKVFTPGENLAVKMAKFEADAAGLASDDLDVTVDNSLFAKQEESGNDTARIKYVRHLQNLDPKVSEVTETITKAVIVNNLDWNGDIYPAIYSAESANCTDHSFYPVYNNKLVSLDGSGCTLNGFPINGAVVVETPEAEGTPASSVLTTGSGNAGLFRLIDNGMEIKDLRLNNFLVAAGGGNAGALAGEITGAPVTVTGVLTTGENGKTVYATGSAGGLIGLLSTSEESKISSSAASVLLSGNVNAGGLIGSLNGSVEISKSYVGGHTVNSEYDTSSVGYNVRGGTNAGGIIGRAEGSAKLTQTFNAASVSAGGENGGGIIGDNHATVTFDTVYSIAPVYGTAITVDSDPGSKENVAGIGNAGAIVGRNSGSITNSGDSVYYLPEVYEKYAAASLKMTVAPIGSGSDMTGGDAKLAYYEKDGENNGVSAKINNGNMQIKTYSYDPTLEVSSLGSNREYPFAIWTEFNFDGGSSAKRTYYGDWQPILSRETITHEVHFRYVDPYISTVKDCTDADLKTQLIHDNKENVLLTPYISNFIGFTISEWRLYENKADSGDISKGIALSSDKGMITIPKTYSYKDYYVTAFYETTGANYLVFYYDETGANTDFTQMGSAQNIHTGTPMADIILPSRLIPGYTFEGWYSDSSLAEDKRIDFTKGTVSGNITAYAKYVPTELYTVTIDFVYQPSGTEVPEQLKNIPQYSLDGVAQYRISRIKGKAFAGDINLPIDQTPLKVEKQFGSTETYSLSADGMKLHIEATDDTSFKVIYSGTPNNMVKYRILYRKYNTKSDGTTYSASSSDYYDYNPYGEKIFQAPAGTVPDIKPDGVSVLGFTAGDIHYKELKDLETDAKEIEQNTFIVDYNRNKHVFDYETNSGLSNTFLRPRTMFYGEILSNLKPEGKNNTTRTGYELNTEGEPENAGWIIHGADSEHPLATPSEYKWTDTMPDEDVVANANWKPGTANYYVLFWKQSVNDDKNLGDADKTYDFVIASERYGTTGTNVKLEEDDINKAGKDDYQGYNFNENNSDMEEKTIRPDGSTVLNVYYDRNLMTFTFDQIPSQAEYDYLRSHYLFDEPEDKPYVDKYTTLSMQGLFGQPLSKYGYQWPALDLGENGFYSWKEPGVGAQSYLGQFLLNVRTKTIETFHYGDKKSRKVEFYLEQPDGNFVLDAFGVSDIQNFSITNKYDGYQYYRYIFDGTYNESIERSTVDTWNKYTHTLNADETQKVLRVAYTRREYTISFINVTDGSTPHKNIKVKFGLDLAEYKPSAPPTISKEYQSLGYKWDGKYYLDEYCTRELDFDKEKMPMNNLRLYVKFVLDDRALTFDLNNPEGEGINPPTMSGTNPVILTNNALTVTSAIANEDGTLKTDYIPVKAKAEGHSEYVFDGWYLDKAFTDPFIYSMEIYSDTTLYAKWKEIKHEVGTLTINFKGRTASEELIDIHAPVEYEYTDPGTGVKSKEIPAGTLIELRAQEIEGYYPENMIQQINIAEGENTATFYYKKIQAWPYTIKYIVDYSSAEGASTLGFSTGAGDSIELSPKISLPLEKTVDGHAENQYETVLFKEMPAGFENYCYIGYVYNGHAMVRDTAALITNEKTDGNVLEFHIAPDPTRVSMEKRYSVYDGVAQSVRDYREAESVAAPENYTARIQPVFRYYDTAGNLLDAANIKNAGVYRMSEFVILYLTGKGGTSAAGKEYKYLLGMDDSKSPNLRIGPRPITATSGSYSREYNPAKPLVFNSLTITGPADGKGYNGTSGTEEGALNGSPMRSFSSAFIGDDYKYIDFTFSVEAFRQDPGMADNSFSYTYKGPDAETNALLKSNYTISTKFGYLVIPWNYDVEYYVRYKSSDLSNAEKTASGITPASPMELLVKSETVEANAKNIRYQFAKPAGYEKYHFADAKCNGKAVTLDAEGKLPIVYNETGTNKLVIYIEPDSDMAVLVDRTVTYKEGETQAMRDAKDFTVLAAPEGYIGKIRRIYNYYDAGGNPIAADALTGPGSYKADGYTVLILTEDKTDGAEYTFVLNKKTDKSLKLEIVSPGT